MTSRQRVTEAINHRVPDRMPIDLGMHTATGISAFAYWHLRQYLGLPNDNVELVDGVQVVARVQEDILRLFNADCIFLRPPADTYRTWSPRGPYAFKVPDYYNPQLNDKGEWVVTRNEMSMRMPVGGYFFDGHWLSMDNVWEEAYFSKVVQEARRVYEETEYFTAFSWFHPYFDTSMDYFCSMITDPEALIEQNRAILKTELAKAALFVEKIGPYVGAVCMSGDLGAQNAPFIGPETFEQVSAPFIKEFCGFIHRHTDCKVFLHTCGAIEPLLPALIDCGIDIVSPVQISAEGMDPENLKRKYGRDMVFWGGGVDTQNVLGFKEPKDVRDNVKHLTDIFKPGGGYVFSPVHNIMGNVPPEHVVAAYAAAFENSGY